LSPILLLIALIIKVTDPGPILYGHKRISRGGKKIKIYKFRTMMTKYCVGPGYNSKSEIEIFQELGRSDLIEEFKRDQKVKDDPRVTKIGKFLRKSSLDELPQLFNVLLGELSLVGPRPIVEDELKRYGRWASYLMSIKPGMTGLWQISGRNDVSYEERVKIDIHYVQNWSLWQDFVILIKTAVVVLVGKSGY
jgi:lipopolysaccharide/colanic/teichoic acid biosynthesis glycosyltransferase